MVDDHYEHYDCPSAPCKKCGHIGNAATCANKPGAVPKAGDLTICIRCGHVSAFREDRTLRELTEGEELHVSKIKAIDLLRKKINDINRQRYS